MNNELAFKDKKAALTACDILSEANYVVMLSREESSYIVNYVWSKDSDRNDVIFKDKEEYEENVKPSVNFELKTEGEIKREIKDYFASQFLVELVDSPQILDEYFYLEFDGAKGDVKMRLPYETNKEDFLAMSSEDRFNWINREALDFLIY